MKKLVIIAIALMLLAGAAFAATTATAPVNIHLTAGTLAISIPAAQMAFDDVTLNGSAQVSHLTAVPPTITVEDTEGHATGGWYVTYGCPDLTNAITAADDRDVIAISAKSTAAEMTYVFGQATTDGGLVKANASLTSLASPVEFLNAGQGLGNGKYTTESKFATNDFEAAIKVVQLAGDYTGTFTATLTRGLNQ